MTHRRRGAIVVVATLGVAGCGGDEGAGQQTAPSAAATSAGTAETCVILLHGKGMTGGPTTESNGHRVIAPTGNAEAWGASEWRYFPDDRYEEARQIVHAAADGCGRVVVGGFSNGASFAAALYCRGETLDDRLTAVVIDDPVTDAGVENCAPAPTVSATLYWTGALVADGPVGADCDDLDWTCQGGVVLGIDAYAAALDLPIVESPENGHTWYRDAPELAAP